MCAVEPPPIVTTRDLLADGMTRRGIERALVAGDLERLRKGVYAVAGACDPVKTAARHGGAVACITAARHLGIWVLPCAPGPHVWLSAHGHTSCPADAATCGCVSHWDEAPVDGRFQSPSVPRVLWQVLRCRGLEAFFVAVESALASGLLSAQGRRWLRKPCGHAARRALSSARSDAGSGLESLFRWRMRRRDVPLRCQVPIYGVGIVDFLLGDRLIVEIDGAEFHDGPSLRHRDLVRDAMAAAWNYVSLRFDYAMVVHDWETVEAAVMSYVDAGLHLIAPRTA